MGPEWIRNTATSSGYGLRIREVKCKLIGIYVYLIQALKKLIISVNFKCKIFLSIDMYVGYRYILI